MAILLVPTVARADGGQYYVVGTGVGIYPRAGASMADDRVGPLLTEGSPVAIACQSYGERVDNGYAPSDVWLTLPNGSFLPSAFVFTGVDGLVPGVPLCDATDVPGVRPEQSESVGGLAVVNDGAVWNQLLNHYYGKSGADVAVDWSLFSENTPFATWAATLPVDNT